MSPSHCFENRWLLNLPRRKFRMVIQLIGLTLILCGSTFAQIEPVKTSAEPAKAPVEELLRQLDADNYQLRESAADQLAQKGVQALKPMVLHSFSSSPESSWRIRSIIESIGTAGSEDTFYKSTGILRLLFPLDDVETSERLEALRQQWKLTRKKNAIRKLQKLGATISDPYGDQIASAGQRGWQVANGGRVIINGRILNPREVTASSTTTKKKAIAASSEKRKSLTRRELIALVDELLESDLATNRERIFGSEGADPVAQGDRLSDAPALRHGAPFAANVLRANQIRTGAMALFDGDFRGTADDLNSLRDIPNLTLIHWKDRKLTPAEMEAAHQFATVRGVHFENCEFPENPLPKSAWPRLATHFEFVNQTIPVWTIERLQNSSVNSLKFSSCSASPVLHEKLRQIDSLSQLALEETLVDQDWFDTFAAVRSLTRVSLNLCKFDPDDYRKLSKLRPKLVVEFTPQAFLGIRSSDVADANLRRARMIARMRAAQKARPGQKIEGPEFDLPVDETGCTISDVVRDSGAEKAGLEAGDVIEKIDGKSISVFEDIRLIIAQHRAGDELDVQFKRDGQLKTATIELGSFPKAAAAIE